MRLTTSRFGEINLETEKIINFPYGIPGFEENRTFILLQTEEGFPFSYMQSTEDGELAFIVTNPFLFFPEYQFDLAQDVQDEMLIRGEADVMVFSIVSVNPSNGEVTLNLLAPVVLNITEKLGRQVILHQTDYKTKHVIRLEDLRSGQEESSMKTKDV